MRIRPLPLARHTLLLLALALPLCLLSGCGDKEPAQRKAFMTYLHERIIEHSGILVPELDSGEKKSFGPYAKHYELLRDFQKKVADNTARNARQLLSLAELETLDAIAKAKNSLRKAAKESDKLQETLAKLRDEADKARAKLAQPDDLKAVYAKAYDKVVTVPAQTAGEAFKAVSATFTATLELLRFIDTHNHDMEIVGQSINLRNPGLMDDLNKRMRDVQEKSEALRQAYAAMMRGML